MKNNYDAKAYDYADEREVYWLYPGCRPAYLREYVATLPASENEYIRPATMPGAQLFAYTIPKSAHNMPGRKSRYWFLLTDVADGIDIRKAPQNSYLSDRLVDPSSIKAGEPSRPAVVARPCRHARRIINDRRKFHGRKPTRWQRIKAFVGIY